MKDAPIPCPECAALKARIQELEAETARLQAALRAAHLEAAIEAGKRAYREAIEEEQE
jgi:hypothetical protein